ncbi:MAG: SDR family oxidoreductase [Ignavibacteriales bacterium]|nr:SDR family oxidoreductase [Ignavibacteriales bacterium]
MTEPATIFVTGGTGFIGTKLVNVLMQSGHFVRVLTRATSNREGLHHERISFVAGDLLNRESLRKGMEGCTQVYHLAAYAKNWSKDPIIFFQQNIEGMKLVFDAARDAGVRRIVFTSTIVVYGPTPPGVVGDESMPRTTQRCFTEYEESKTLAQQEALKYVDRGQDIVVVNPTRVYGPGKLTEGNSVTLMISMYDKGKVPVLLNKGLNVGNYVFVDDLVKGHVLAMERGKTGESYILGGENASLKHLFDLVDAISGKQHFQINLPPPIARFYSRVERKKAEWLGLYPQITPGWVETFLHDWAYTSTKAEREIGYTITPLREGIRITYEWLKQATTKR